MTNHEWLKTLNAEELVDWIYDEWLDHLQYMYSHSRLGLIDWLSHEKEPGNGVPGINNSDFNTDKHGHWISLGHRMGYLKHPYSVDYKCSECGYETYWFTPNKCPQCHTEMIQPWEEEEDE